MDAALARVLLRSATVTLSSRMRVDVIFAVAACRVVCWIFWLQLDAIGHHMRLYGTSVSLSFITLVCAWMQCSSFASAVRGHREVKVNCEQ